LSTVAAYFDLRNRRKRQRLVANAIGLAVFAIMVFPTYWMVNTAFKPGRDILTLTPNFYGRRAFIAVIIGVQMIPSAALIIPLYILFARAGQVDHLSGVIIAYLTFVLPFTVWTLRGFVMGIPRELEEAAMVDGATRMGAFIRILVPLIAPGLVATSIFAFVQAWNEFIFAYVLLSSQEHQTLTVWLATFTTLRGTDWGPLMAAATLTSLPVVVFVAFGLTAGAVRG
jgi:N,N'-diacetylchitobiose transport system permease protein